MTTDAAVIERAAGSPDEPGVRALPTQFREAQIVPASYNEADNTVDVCWTTGARRRAFDWWSGQQYDEELVVSAEAVNMERFEAGTVQALDGHRVYGGVSAIIGIATRGWLDGGKGMATLKLSGRQEMAGVVGDIKSGVIRAISFGYSVEAYEVTDAKARRDGGAVPLWRATKWTPQEISFVTVPADPNAQTRGMAGADGKTAAPAHAGPLRDCTFTRSASAEPVAASPAVAAPHPATAPTQETRTMADPVQTAQGAAAASSAADTAAAAALAQRQQAEQQALQRAADITELCARHGVQQLAAGLIRSGADEAGAQRAALDELARRDAAAGGHINTRVETVRDELQTRLQGMEEALVARVDSRAKLTDNGRQFRGMSMLEMGRDMLERGGVNTRGMDRMTLATRMLSFRSGGMLTTSDFSNVLANVATKRLRMGYDENPGTYTRWARRAPNAPDFKNITVAQLSAMPDLLQVNEHGEFKYGSMKDGGETYALITYGRIVSLSRQAIVNDDLRAFDRMVTGFGGAAMRLENRLVYAQLTANANLADGGALFNSTAVTTAGGHANLGSGAPSALQFSSLVTGRTAMRVQKGLQLEELNIAPAYLIVPAALEQTAYQLTSSNYVPATKAEVNEFRSGGRTALDPIVEPILDANSATAWYLAAATSQVDTVEFCWLDGAEGPVLESEMGFDVDGVSFKCREDFAAKALDFRGLYKSAGA